MEIRMNAKDLGWTQFDPFPASGRFELITRQTTNAYSGSDDKHPIIGLTWKDNRSREHGWEFNRGRMGWWVWVSVPEADRNPLTSRKGWWERVD
jgi:hypothetical protein